MQNPEKAAKYSLLFTPQPDSFQKIPLYKSLKFKKIYPQENATEKAFVNNNSILCFFVYYWLHLGIIPAWNSLFSSSSGII